MEWACSGSIEENPNWKYKYYICFTPRGWFGLTENEFDVVRFLYPDAEYEIKSHNSYSVLYAIPKDVLFFSSLAFDAGQQAEIAKMLTKNFGVVHGR